ncbi:MAG: flagellar biosynthesis anti-sigma factor FlgM [Pirellulaceae bacterium]|nr:flagellar biosynthesis anti-sigma factor FlgM [Pirellulaceae bacterium]
MRIDSGPKSPTPHLPSQRTHAASARTGQAAAGNPNQPLLSVDVKSIDSLMQTVAAATDVRDAVVSDIKMKIQTGEYLAKQSAYETASAILNL